MIKAIETKYNGYKFRSRLEARWAVFFDTLGIKYEYEKEGYELKNNEEISCVWFTDKTLFYLPDFFIPKQKDFLTEMYFEIKNDGGLEGIAKEKIARLSFCKNVKIGVLFSVPFPKNIEITKIDNVHKIYHHDYWRDFAPLEEQWPCYFPDFRHGANDVSWDGLHCFCECPFCSVIGYHFMGYSGKISCCEKNKNEHKNCRTNSLSPRLINAYQAARSARFEYHLPNGIKEIKDIREAKVCIKCKNYIPPTNQMQSECSVEEDMQSTEWNCEGFEIK